MSKKERSMTKRSAWVRMTAAKVVNPGEPGWKELWEVISYAAEVGASLPLWDVSRQMAKLEDAFVGNWVVWTHGHDLRVRTQAWVDEHLPEHLPEQPTAPPHKRAKRCRFVWHDEHGWHQCPEPRALDHRHDQIQPGVGWGFVRPSWEGIKRCLGVGLYGGEIAGVPFVGVDQCGCRRSDCSEEHDFYPSLRLGPEEGG